MLKALGDPIVRALPRLRPIAQRIYRGLPAILQNNVAGLLERHFLLRRSISLMQIGAHDGDTADPISRLLLEHDRYSGILLEPQPIPFARLQKRYASVSNRIHCLNCAIGPRDVSTSRLYYIPEDVARNHGMSDWSSMLSSFHRGHLEDHFRGIPISSMEVDVISIDEAMQRASFQHIDALVIDVEGAEAQIIPSIDFDETRVEFLCFEHIHLSHGSRETINNQLLRSGFKLRTLSLDTIATRRL